MKILLLTLLFLSSLYANKVIYFNYEEVPQRVVKGEIFPITLKALSTLKNSQDIAYKFSNYQGLKLLTEIPSKEERGKYSFDTFYFLTTRAHAKLPDIEAYLPENDDAVSSFISGRPLNVISLNPKKDFSNIIANSFELVEYKTTQFDNKHNIVVLVAKATNSDINNMKFQNVYKQGIESSTESHLESRITYFIVIDKKKENFSFSYFNLIKNKFIPISIPIIVDDDSVVAQSDLKPKDQSHDKIKAFIALAVALMGIIFIVIRKKYSYLVFIIIPIGYIIYISIPSKSVCIKKGADIHLLPVSNGTIFETTTNKQHMVQEGSVDKFVKVKLHNEKIGWVKNEDICSH